MSRPYAERRPTEAAAIGRASKPDTSRLPASEQQLRERLLAAVAREDGAALRLLAAHMQRDLPQ